MKPAGQNRPHILSIGTDASIFDRNSLTRRRLEAYAAHFGSLHVIALGGSGFRPEQVSARLFLYPAAGRTLLVRIFAAWRIGCAILREHPIDILTVQDPAESGLAGWLVGRTSGLPFHIQVHSDFFSPFFRANSWKEYVRYRIARFIIPRGDSFRAVSERLARSLESMFGISRARIVILPIFVDREAITNARPAFNLRQRHPDLDFIVLMVSRLNRDKRVDLALNAFAEFRKEFPQAGLMIVGDGPERKNLESRIKNLELTAWVKLEGWQNDLVSYYKGADIYLLTSAFEGYGRAVIEAAAAGVPIIMTDVGVAGDVVRDGETGRVVRVGDHAALVRALVAAHRDYPVMRRMAERAQAEVRRLPPRTREEYLERYRESYENLLRH